MGILSEQHEKVSLLLPWLTLSRTQVVATLRSQDGFRGGPGGRTTRRERIGCDVARARRRHQNGEGAVGLFADDRHPSMVVRCDPRGQTYWPQNWV